MGLGGRLDATNIVKPEVGVITHVDFDHEGFLGHSLEEIAGEKAGIIKQGVPLVLAEQRKAVRETIFRQAMKLGAPVVETGKRYRTVISAVSDERMQAKVAEQESGKTIRVAPSLRGRFQIGNAINAVAVARLLQARGVKITDEAIEQGIANAIWPGRIEKLWSNPDIYLDGAHNPSAARELANFLKENFTGRNVTLIFGAMRDKAVDEIAGILFPLAGEVIFTQPKISRAISAEQLAEIAGEYAAKFRVVSSAERALEEAVAHTLSGDAIFVTGSLYLVGELRQYWKTRLRVAAR